MLVVSIVGHGGSQEQCFKILFESVESPDYLRILGSEILGRIEGKVGSFSDWFMKIMDQGNC
jgi:hypothetical protein